MTFKRELILQRLVAIAQEIDGVKTTARDVLHFDDDMLPAIGVLEGDEEAEGDDPVEHEPTAIRRVTMTPHVVVVGGALPENLGSTLNGIYAKLVRAVLSDDELKLLVLDRIKMRFMGMESDLAIGRQMLGQMAAKFQFTYLLDPLDL